MHAEPTQDEQRRIVGAYLGARSFLLLACGHEMETGEPVAAGTAACHACRSGAPSQPVTATVWAAWCDAKQAQEATRR